MDCDEKSQFPQKKAKSVINQLKLLVHVDLRCWIFDIRYLMLRL